MDCEYVANPLSGPVGQISKDQRHTRGVPPGLCQICGLRPEDYLKYLVYKYVCLTEGKHRGLIPKSTSLFDREERLHHSKGLTSAATKHSQFSVSGKFLAPVTLGMGEIMKARDKLTLGPKGNDMRSCHHRCTSVRVLV